MGTAAPADGPRTDPPASPEPGRSGPPPAPGRFAVSRTGDVAAFLPAVDVQEACPEAVPADLLASV